MLMMKKKKLNGMKKILEFYFYDAFKSMSNFFNEKLMKKVEKWFGFWGYCWFWLVMVRIF